MMDKQITLLDLKIKLYEKKLARADEGYIEFPEIWTKLKRFVYGGIFKIGKVQNIKMWLYNFLIYQPRYYNGYYNDKTGATLTHMFLNLAGLDLNQMEAVKS